MGGQVLIGLAVGFAYYLLLGVLATILSERVALQTPVGLFRLSNVPDIRHLAGSYVSALQLSVQIPLILFFVFFLLRVLLRRDWMVSLVVILLIGGLVLASSPDPLIAVLFSTTIIALVLFILIRFGILPLVAMFYVVALTNGIPITSDLSAWYAGGTVLSTVMILALAAYAFHIARAGRPLFKEGFLED